MRFSLAWRVEVETAAGDRLVLNESLRVAYNGEQFSPAPLYLRLGIVGESTMFYLILAPSWCIAIAAIAFLLMKRRLSRILVLKRG
ncbi:MAG: hypothetical protein EAX81_00575 [Candidatus Thorarchaeota archaeon]|nr:hypothetical protein [Candidatus Thorarchaeota archaeon]